MSSNIPEEMMTGLHVKAIQSNLEEDAHTKTINSNKRKLSENLLNAYSVKELVILHRMVSKVLYHYAESDYGFPDDSNKNEETDDFPDM